ncbi:hypothetical protein IEO21_03979 [Rhodonia placenta]|uniref:NTF2 domain-containing protein n=2 Tax=Rhodonia placenta TaxID=104341 RepID=A0A1X6MXU7_9APHY|nr:hypothetical protein POSPLADRAFT_1066427 [Postia placenta MAD-698-R-SB12]KAF9816578.1 hypothetical protein IEO21_03979 [Postia placenta]OSX61046.1 hypothetical protein POSPLADRAFT_1066427 [Postia placenta MAD-698-R-SB12]
MTNGTSTVNPSEVGWQFVPQYYTFVNKQPNRLHCFYTKASTFIHGTEGEDGKPCYGQQEIHNKITSIGFQDCKVFIHSVDAQSSANGGIIIQVIGEMSNKGEPWRKFVQTFFLAEQPNGYFVLNDIFRFLKEEAVESDDQASEVDATAPSQQPQSVPPVPLSPTPPPPPAELQPEPPVTPTPPPASKPAEEAPAPAAPSPAPEPQTNGVHAPEPEVEPAPAPVERSPSPAPEPPATASPPPVSPPAQHEPLPSVPAPAPVAAPAPAPPAHVHPPAPAPAAPQPMQPPQRKTWANLAAKDSNKWGAAVANEVRGVSEAPVTAVPAPLSGPQSPAPHVTTRPTVPRDQPHPALLAAQNVQTAQCFVKSVTENIPDSALRNTLIQRFGPVKELEILRAKACAFLEFTQLEAARRAIAASLPIGQGGEGGIRIDLEGGGQGRIIVETRKERGERPPPRGPPMNGGDRGRGGFRGRGGPGGGRGRGGPMPPK